MNGGYQAGPREIEAGSKIMSVGLDEHNPVQALQQLLESKETMSEVLHEMTHFYSLENTLGDVLSFLGLLAANGRDYIRTCLKKNVAVEPNQLDLYLHFLKQFHLMRGAWMPLLEGLAMYVQTSHPCKHVDMLIAPLDTLCNFGLVLSALDPSYVLTDSGQSFEQDVDKVSQGILSKGYSAMTQGPQLTMYGDGGSLASALELDKSEAWFPYFLGHAYVRALQDRLARVTRDFVCPEQFLNLMLRIMRASSRRLLGRNTGWDMPEAINRIYNWIELIEKAPLDRICRINKLEDNIDLLWFLQTGESLVGYHPSSENVGQSIAQVIPKIWELYENSISSIDFNEIAQMLGDSPFQVSSEEATTSVVAGWVIGTRSLNLCSTGCCYLSGWIPRGLGERHVILVRVEKSTWWLSIGETELASLPCDVTVIPHLPAEALQASGSSGSSSNHVELQVNCFVTHVGYGLPPWGENISGRLYPRWLFEFVNSDPSQGSLLTTVVPGSNRGILQPVSRETAQALHINSQSVRHQVTGALPSLEGLANDFAKKRGQENLVALTQAKACEEKLALSRQQELWSRRILMGLLGARTSSRVRRDIIMERMNSLLSNQDQLKDLLPLSYTEPSRIEGKIIPFIESINNKAISEIGKPIFAIDNVIPIGNECKQKERFQNAACNSASRMKSNEVNDWTCCALNCSSS